MSSVNGDDHPTGEPTHGELAATTHADPLAGQPGEPGFAAEDSLDDALAAPPPPASKLVAAVLAAIVAMLVGVAVWAVVHVQLEREYVGVSVVIGLATGWLLRVLSGRSSWPVRILAVVITALGCVAGTVVSHAAYDHELYNQTFGERLGDLAGNVADEMSGLPKLTFAIFAAALVLAFLSASPQKEKKPKGGTAATDPAPLSDGGADEAYDPAYDGASDDPDGAGDDEQPPPPRMTAG